MKTDRTYYSLILDCSGSMNSVIEETVAGLNQHIIRIKELAARYPEKELFTSMTFFNNNISQIYSRVFPESLKEITFSDYRPDGSTALLDAIGMEVSNLQKGIGSEIEDDEAKCYVVIITDGFENSSRYFLKYEEIASTINKLEESGKWKFSFVGTNLNAMEVASKLNIKRENTMHFNFSDSFLIFSNIGDSICTYLEEKDGDKINISRYEDDD